MHIPANLLHGNICPVTAAVTGTGIGLSIYSLKYSKENISGTKWAGITALIFIMQMLNFPVTNGTSGHLIGGALLASLLGIPRAILSMAVILWVQSAYFADGGMDALGANILNMSLICAGFGGFLMKYFQKRGISIYLAMGAASFISVVLASLACTIEVALSGTINFNLMAQSMLSVHCLIAIGESVLTVILWKAISKLYQTEQKTKIILRYVFFTLTVLAIAPFASNFPDGLDSVLTHFRVPLMDSNLLGAVFQNYQVPMIQSAHVSVSAAGLIGGILVYFFILILNRSEILLKERRIK